MSKQLAVYNSLTKSVVPFITESKHIKWYTCGPTVYDHSHIDTHVIMSALIYCVEF